MSRLRSPILNGTAWKSKKRFGSMKKPEPEWPILMPTRSVYEHSQTHHPNYFLSGVRYVLGHDFACDSVQIRYIPRTYGPGPSRCLQFGWQDPGLGEPGQDGQIVGRERQQATTHAPGTCRGHLVDCIQSGWDAAGISGRRHNYQTLGREHR